MWVFVLKLGVYVILVGVLIVLIILLKEKNGDKVLLYKVEYVLYFWVVYMILLIFVFVNVGVSFIGLLVSDFM